MLTMVIGYAITLEHSPFERRIFYFTTLSTTLYLVMMLRSSRNQKRKSRETRTKNSFVQQTEKCHGKSPALRRTRRPSAAIVSPPFVRASQVVLPSVSASEAVLPSVSASEAVLPSVSAEDKGEFGGRSGAGAKEDAREWDDIDIGGFLDDLESDELEQGIMPPGAGSTDTTKAYSRSAGKVINDFVSHLDSLDVFHEFTARVENPFKFGSFGEGYLAVVPRIFVDLTGDVSFQKVRLANRVLCSWQDQYKKKKAGVKDDDRDNCPYYQPSSQNHMLRVFFAGMNKRFGWQLGMDDLSGFPGSLTAMLAKKYSERKAIWVSDVCGVFYFICLLKY